MHRGRERAGKVVRRKPLRQVFVYCMCAEPFEADRRSVAPRDELAGDPVERVAPEHLRVSIYAHEQYPRGLSSARKESHELDGRRVRPLQIIERDDYRYFRAHRVERVDQLSQRAPWRRASRTTLKLGKPIRSNQSRHLR